MKHLSQTLVLVLVVFICCQGMVLAAGVCSTATIDEPIIIPAGGEYPGGSLTVCEFMKYSPVSSLHKLYVDGNLVGVFSSWRGKSEGNEGFPFFMFNRDQRGKLHLYGYAHPKGDRMVTFLLSKPGKRKSRGNSDSLNAVATHDSKDRRGSTGPQAVFLAAHVR
jgi:hypothetical protein